MLFVIFCLHGLFLRWPHLTAGSLLQGNLFSLPVETPRLFRAVLESSCRKRPRFRPLLTRDSGLGTQDWGLDGADHALEVAGFRDGENRGMILGGAAALQDANRAVRIGRRG